MAKPRRTLWVAALLALGLCFISPVLSVAKKVPPTPIPTATVTGTPTPEAPRESTLIVLGYHQFGMKKGDPYCLSPAEFHRQLQWILDHGWTVVGLDQVMAHWEKGADLPEKSVLLTFDDGFRSIFTGGFPVLRQFGWPGVLFLYTDLVKWQGGALHYADIEEMSRNGLSVQCHSQTHPNFGLLKNELSPKDYAARLKAEMVVSREFLREKLKADPVAFAYPYGVYNDEAVQAARAAGYRMAFTVNPGPNDRTIDPFYMHRELVMSDTTPRQFEGFFTHRVLHLAHLMPADGAVILTRKPVFFARILDEVDPKSVRMYLGDRPLAGVQYDPRTGRLRRALKILLPRGGHLVTVTAVDRRGIPRTFSWYFRIYCAPGRRKTDTRNGVPLRPYPQTESEGEGHSPLPSPVRTFP